MKTEADYLEAAKRWAEIDSDDLTKNDFTPKVSYHVDIDRPRLVFFPQLDGVEATRNKVCWAIGLLGAGIDDLWAVTFAMDTYQATSMTKHDGSDWGYGEMQEAYNNKTVDADLVHEAFTYQIQELDGSAIVSVFYTRPDDGGPVEFQWDDAKVMVAPAGDERAKLQGAFPEAMEQAFQNPKLMDVMRKEVGVDLLGLDLEAARIHAMAVVVKMVINQIQMPCLVPTYTENEAAILKRSMEDGPFSENIKSYDSDEIEEIHSLEEAFDAPAHQE